MKLNQPVNQLGMAVICLGASIAPLDFSVNIAFPAMTAAFRLGTQDIRWVAICYMLSYGGLMMLFGAIGDRRGHLKVFQAGLVLALLAFLMCALAPTYPLLLIGRIIQGVASALTVSCAPALVLMLFHEQRRTWALSMYSAYFALASAIAPLLGGLMTGVLGWPGVYWFRLPIVLLALGCLGVVRIPEDPAGRYKKQQVSQSIGVVLRSVFEKDHNFLWINVSNFVIQLTVFTIPLLVPYYLIQRRGWSSLECGVALSVWASGTIVGSFLAQRVAQRMPVALMAYLSAWISTIALLVIGVWSEDVSVVFMLVCLGVTGLGLGFYQVAYADQVIAALPRTSRGVAGSLTQVSRTVGVIIGAFLWLWIFEQSQTWLRSTTEPQPFMSAFSTVFLCSGAMAAAFLILTAFLPGLWLRQKASD